MTLVRKVSDGNGGEVRTVSLQTLFVVMGILGSVIGAQSTWLIAAASERRAVVEEFRETMRQSEAAHVSRLISIEGEIQQHGTRLLSLEHQVAINTGVLEATRRR